MTFVDLVKERRSAIKFIPDTVITHLELEEMFNLVKFAPSAFNLQHTRYIVVDDPIQKDAIYEAASKQYKVKSASAVIVVMGDKESHKNVAAMNEGLLNLGAMNKQEYDMTVESVTQFYQGRGEAFQLEDAIRNASLSAMLFMLIAKDKGWDTCPMIGFDPALIQKQLNVPEQFVPVMLIAIGKEDHSRPRPRGYRKPLGEFVSYNGF